MNTGITAINEAVQQGGAFLRPLFGELGKVIVGQTYLVERLVIGLLANGHVLLEGVPGLAKTLSVKSLANCLNVTFSQPTSSAPKFTTRNPAPSLPVAGRFLPTWFLRMKSTAPRPKSRAPCSK